MAHSTPPTAQPDGAMLTVPACPACDAPIAQRLSIVVERIRQAAKRPVLPEVLHACSCGTLYVVSLRPEPGR